MARGADLQRVQRTGRRSRQRDLDIRWATTEQGEARLGLIVPRHGRTAVARNRLQRRLRELWRRGQRPRQPALDVVIRTRPSAYGASFTELAEQLAAWRGGLDQPSPQPIEGPPPPPPGAASPVAGLLALLIRGYQRFLSPALPPACRFHPTCSQYALEAVRRHGATRGSWLALRRLAKCHPWHPGGFDPVP